MQRCVATLDRFALVTEATAVLEPRLGTGTLTLQRGDVGVASFLLAGLPVPIDAVDELAALVRAAGADEARRPARAEIGPGRIA